MGEFCILFCTSPRVYLYEKASKKLPELKVLHELLKEINKFQDNQVKPDHATGTQI